MRIKHNKADIQPKLARLLAQLTVSNFNELAGWPQVEEKIPRIFQAFPEP